MQSDLLVSRSSVTWVTVTINVGHCHIQCRSLSPSMKVIVTFNIMFAIDGSTDRCCIAVVTNESALLSGSNQPVRNLGCRHIMYVRRENLVDEWPTASSSTHIIVPSSTQPV